MKNSEEKIIREVVEEAYLKIVEELSLKELSMAKLLDKIKILHGEIRDLNKQLEKKDKDIIKLEKKALK